MSQEFMVCVHGKRSTWMLSTDAGCQTKALFMLVKNSVRGHVSSPWHFSLQHMGLSPCPTLFTVAGWLGLYAVFFSNPSLVLPVGRYPSLWSLAGDSTCCHLSGYYVFNPWEGTANISQPRPEGIRSLLSDCGFLCEEEAFAVSR